MPFLNVGDCQQPGGITTEVDGAITGRIGAGQSHLERAGRKQSIVLQESIEIDIEIGSEIDPHASVIGAIVDFDMDFDFERTKLQLTICICHERLFSGKPDAIVLQAGRTAPFYARKALNR